MTSAARPIPRASYRLQLNQDFRFTDAAALAPYLQRLGISHAYLSPILMARPGSTHCYDTVDHRRINPDLGSLDDFRSMAVTLRAHGIGIIADIVPNHMGIGGDANPYWQDVLEWGEESRFADWFDIDWHPHEPGLDGRVLVPFLGVSYGEALVEGILQLLPDPGEGSFAVWAHGNHKLPINPANYAMLLQGTHEAFDSLARAFGRLSRGDNRQGRAEDLKRRLSRLLARHEEAARALARRVAQVNGEPGDAATKRSLDALISMQHWRPARFDVADDEINYRRFFAVSDLAAIRIERPEVFEQAHRLIFELVGEGLIEGLRVDHIDGLLDPKAYCHALLDRVPRPVYLVVEKILSQGERLSEDWRVDGTTGYEFGALVTRLLVDPEGLEALGRLRSAAHLGPPAEFGAVVMASKYRIMQRELHAELDALSARIAAFARKNIFTRDLSRRRIRHALEAFIAAMDRYRTYIDRSGVTGEDHGVIKRALGHAAGQRPELGPAVWSFLGDVLVGEDGENVPPGISDEAVRLAMRVQQATGPVMAKGLEDTALYRDTRLIALNDVGSRPDLGAATIAEFHAANRLRAEVFPHSMLGTSSHDSKRGEDARARIAALSGHVEAWAPFVADCRHALAGARGGDIHPDDFVMLMQMLVGAWPAGLDIRDGAGLASLTERLAAAMQKSLREAQLRSGWTDPDMDYEDRVIGLARRWLADPGFLERFAKFEASIAWSGAMAGLVGAVLKLTVPGVPDIYRGGEVWEQSMVDPDNRRAIDFQHLATTLPSGPLDIAGLAPDWRDGRLKQALIAALLGLRRLEADLLALGTYEPLACKGQDGERICAFLRRHGSKAMFVAVRLYPWRDGAAIAPPDPQFPAGVAADGWRDVFRPVSAPARPSWAGALPFAVATNFPVVP